MLGESSFEFIQLLLHKRKEIIAKTTQAIQQEKLQLKQHQRDSGSSNSSGPQQPKLVGQIRITNENEKQMEKLAKKQDRKNRKEMNEMIATTTGNANSSAQEDWLLRSGLLDPNHLKEQREYQLQTAKEMKPLAAAGSTADSLAGNI